MLDTKPILERAKECQAGDLATVIATPTGRAFYEHAREYVFNLVTEIDRIRAVVKKYTSECCESPEYGRGVGHGFCESFGCSTLAELVDPDWKPGPVLIPDPDDEP